MHATKLVCFKCGHAHPADKPVFRCEKCAYSLDVHYDYAGIAQKVSTPSFQKAPIRHWKYWPFYPVTDFSKIVSMHEGGTALIHSRHHPHVWLKCEGVNPTGSFKDRGSTVEITQALARGADGILCASTGNMGASLAAYAARTGIASRITVPKFTSAEKIRQMHAYGANVKKKGATYEEALAHVWSLHEKNGTYLAGDFAYRTEGQKSVGFEIADQLEWNVPKHIVCPVGNGTLLFAVYKAFLEMKKAGLTREMPRIHGAQAKGCHTLREGKVRKVKKPKTAATAIDCGNPVYGLEALDALKKTKGKVASVSDKDMIAAQKDLASEGVYAELSGAATLAASQKLGLSDETVLVISGHGLKESKKYY